MRTRKEIEAVIENKVPNNFHLLEVLLDIRDLLSKKKQDDK